MNEQNTAEAIDEFSAERGRRLLQELGTLERNGASERAQKMDCWRAYGLILLPIRAKYPAHQVFAKVIREVGLDVWPAQAQKLRSEAMWLAGLAEHHLLEIRNTGCPYSRPDDIHSWARKQKFEWMPPPKKRPPPPEPEPTLTDIRNELPETARARFDRVLQKAIDVKSKELAVQYQQAHWQAVTAEVERRLPTHAEKEVASARAALQAMQRMESVWRTRAHACRDVVRLFVDNFRTLASVLHPDRAPPERQEQYSRAMETLNRIKDAIDKINYEKWGSE